MSARSTVVALGMLASLSCTAPDDRLPMLALDLELANSEIAAMQRQINSLATATSDLEVGLSDVRYLSVFGGPSVIGGIDCGDGANMTEGTRGAAAYRALQASHYCDPNKRVEK